VTTLATDDFNRADSGSLGANWSAFSVSVSSPSIVSNAAQDTGGNDSGAIYSAATFPADQWAQVVRTGGDGGGVVVRGATPRTWYSIHIEGTFGASANLLFAKFLVGAFTSISSQTVTFNSGDTLYGEIQSTTLLAKRNGSALGTSTTDSSIGSGKAGIFGFGAYIADDFAAGDFAGGGGANPKGPLGMMIFGPLQRVVGP
jgi:hypothetical protein